MNKSKFLSVICIIVFCFTLFTGCADKRQPSAAIETDDVWSETTKTVDSSAAAHSQNQSRSLINDFYTFVETTNKSVSTQKKQENVDMLKGCLDMAKSYQMGSFDEDKYIKYIYKVLVEINRLYMQNGSEYELIIAADELDGATANLSLEMSAALKTVTGEEIIETGKIFARYGLDVIK